MILGYEQSYPTGNISKYFSELKVGDKVNMKGPKGQMKYTPSYAKHIGMIAGGTGITPMLVSFPIPSFSPPRAFFVSLRPLRLMTATFVPLQQIIRAALKNPLDKTRLSLIYANVGETDILLKKELDSLADRHAARFDVFYVLNNPPEKWNGGTGFVTTEMIKEKLPAPATDSRILLCGEWCPLIGLCRLLLADSSPTLDPLQDLHRCSLP